MSKLFEDAEFMQQFARLICNREILNVLEGNIGLLKDPFSDEKV